MVLLLLLLLLLLLRGDRGGGDFFLFSFFLGDGYWGRIGVEYSGMVDRFVIVRFDILSARRSRLCAAGCSFFLKGKHLLRIFWVPL